MQTYTGLDILSRDAREEVITDRSGHRLVVQTGSFYRSTGTPTERSEEYAELCFRLTGGRSGTLPSYIMPKATSSQQRWLMEIALRRGVTETAACAQGLYWQEGPAVTWQEICDIAQWIVSIAPEEGPRLQRTLKMTKEYVIAQREDLAMWLNIQRPFPGVHGPSIDAARASFRRADAILRQIWYGSPTAKGWPSLRDEKSRPLYQAHYDRLEASPAEDWEIPDLAAAWRQIIARRDAILATANASPMAGPGRWDWWKIEQSGRHTPRSLADVGEAPAWLVHGRELYR